MKLLKRSIRLLVAGVGLSIFCASASSTVIFNDDFSSGNLSKTQSTARWNSSTRVTISSEQYVSGPESARFLYEGSSDPSKDAFAELRFDLGNWYPELWLQFKLYIPSNYKHRSVSPNNNKLLRLWNENYSSDSEKLGFSTWANSGGSTLRADWNSGTGIGPKGEGYSSFITSADRGKWMTIRIHAKAATSSERGTLQLWKNGELVVSNVGTVNNYASGERHAFRYGYLLGWSNSGYDVNTALFIDDVIFATSAKDLSGDTAAEVPPQAPVLQIQ